MEIRKASVQGFCFGVAITVKKAEEAIASRGEVTTLGHVVHNPQMVESLQSRGLRNAQSVDEVDAGSLFVRAHGLPVDVFEKAKDKGLEIIDATCPMVTKIHVQAEKLEVRRLQDRRDRRSRSPGSERNAEPRSGRVVHSRRSTTSRDFRARARSGVVVQSTWSGQGFTRDRAGAGRQILRGARGQYDLHRHAQPAGRSVERSRATSK